MSMFYQSIHSNSKTQGTDILTNKQTQGYLAKKSVKVLKTFFIMYLSINYLNITTLIDFHSL